MGGGSAAWSDGELSTCSSAVAFTGSPYRLYQFGPLNSRVRCKIDMACGEFCDQSGVSARHCIAPRATSTAASNREYLMGTFLL